MSTTEKMSSTVEDLTHIKAGGSSGDKSQQFKFSEVQKTLQEGEQFLKNKGF